MIWVVDKKVVPHLLTRWGLLAEIPLRISFEYALDSGAVIDGSLSIKVLYNGRMVDKCFPGIEKDALDVELRKTANDAVSEHLALSGVASGNAAQSVVVAAR